MHLYILQANDTTSITGKPAFTITYDTGHEVGYLQTILSHSERTEVDVSWPGNGVTLNSETEKFDVQMTQTPMGATLNVTLNIGYK